jgi:fimbrial chaperone protein
MKFMSQSLLLSLCLSLAAIQPAMAFKLLPISRTFKPVGREATQSYQVVNDKQERLAVEVSMVKRQMDLLGKETYQPAEDDFLIYPAQILLEPGETQTVRVTWLGDPAPKQELAYRLVAEQLPVNLSKPQQNRTQPIGQIKLLIRYLGSVYIRPENIKPHVVLKAVSPQPAPGESQQLSLIVDNQGTAHAILKNVKLNLNVTGSAITLRSEQLQAMNNAVILAGNQRQFTLPWPQDLPRGPVTATLDFDQKR